MKRLSFLASLVVLLPGAALAQGVDYYRGYVRRDGTYVAPHYQTHPDGNPYNNWSTRGNVNPYTGQPGRVDLNRNTGNPFYPSSGSDD